jgi:hypothetical protein
MNGLRHPRGAALAAAAVAAAVILAFGADAVRPAPALAAGRNATPVYAYYYIWFNPSSWNRAKRDYPALGRYSSDEASVMRQHIRWAKAAGINGFVVSWKGTPLLDRRLQLLVATARDEHFKLAIIYQGLDFERRPLAAPRVARDLEFFARRYAGSPVFDGWTAPVVVWSGTWKFTPDQIRSVTRRFRGRLRILATERNPADYEAKAELFDGDAYYWSSVNPDTAPRYEQKLQRMSQTVHAHRGLWFAPAAPGFDGRMVGGRTAVDRKGGKTLRREFDAAQASGPDAIGLISWNEFSENSHVEPSRNHGSTALGVVADIRDAHFSAKDAPDSSDAAGARGAGPGAIPVLAGFGLLLVASFVLVARRRRSSSNNGAQRRSDPAPARARAG